MEKHKEIDGFLVERIGYKPETKHVCKLPSTDQFLDGSRVRCQFCGKRWEKTTWPGSMFNPALPFWVDLSHSTPPKPPGTSLWSRMVWNRIKGAWLLFDAWFQRSSEEHWRNTPSD